MPFLIDTHILSELRKGPRCDSKVASWALREGEMPTTLVCFRLGKSERESNFSERNLPSNVTRSKFGCSGYG